MLQHVLGDIPFSEQQQKRERYLLDLIQYFQKKVESADNYLSYQAAEWLSIPTHTFPKLSFTIKGTHYLRFQAAAHNMLFVVRFLLGELHLSIPHVLFERQISDPALYTEMSFVDIKRYPITVSTGNRVWHLTSTAIMHLPGAVSRNLTDHPRIPNVYGG